LIVIVWDGGVPNGAEYDEDAVCLVKNAGAWW